MNYNNKFKDLNIKNNKITLSETFLYNLETFKLLISFLSLLYQNKLEKTLEVLDPKLKGATTFSITTFGVTTLRIIIWKRDTRDIDTEHYDIEFLCWVSFMLSFAIKFIKMGVVMLNVMALIEIVQLAFNIIIFTFDYIV